MVTKLIASLSMTALGFTASICTMMYGWGVSPQSWGWIIGGSIAATICAAFAQLLARE